MKKRDRDSPPSSDTSSDFAPSEVALHALYQHDKWGFPRGYGFYPSDEDLLHFLHELSNGVNFEITACPINHICNVYALTPEVLASRYTQGNRDSYFFLSKKKYASWAQNRVVSTKEGYWRKKKPMNKIRVHDRVLGNKITLEYYQGSQQKTSWLIEEYSKINIKEKIQNIICRLYKTVKETLPPNEKKQMTGQDITQGSLGAANIDSFPQHLSEAQYNAGQPRSSLMPQTQQFREGLTGAFTIGSRTQYETGETSAVQPRRDFLPQSQVIGEGSLGAANIDSFPQHLSEAQYNAGQPRSSLMPQTQQFREGLTGAYTIGSRTQYETGESSVVQPRRDFLPQSQVIGEMLSILIHFLSISPKLSTMRQPRSSLMPQTQHFREGLTGAVTIGSLTQYDWRN
ncbi:unnamed protein product [Microthlaspi erraticum]|uniref:NAC domain-containing protein n=1 Tax=Microthlaspi erraticum TaxID=1685480 RepID=A0A6D2L1S6_9BRAS|nr:unnamed protein product [Microthlaspi erraticum]